MKISLFVSLCCSVVFYSSAGQAACVQPLSCDELGFTADASKCEGSFLKCPWDLSKAACKEKTPLPILYEDGTVASKIIDSKTPIGVVFDETNKLAVALTDVKKDGTPGSERMYWSNNNYDIPDLENCGYTQIPSFGRDTTSISCGTDGRLNTDAILSSESSCGGTPAATAANSYQPAGCTKDFCKKTKWFLPSIRDLLNISMEKGPLNTTLVSLSSKGAATIGLNFYWSSTEYSDFTAWTLDMNSDRHVYYKCDNNGYVRPVLAY